MKRDTLFVASLICALCTSVASAGTVTSLSIAGGGPGDIGSFTGKITYDNVGLLKISLTNTSNPSNGGFLTGFVFNIDGNASASLNSSPDPAPFQNISNANAAPFGTFEHGAALGGNFLGGGNPNGGIAVGETRMFGFDITGPSAGTLKAVDFFKELSTGRGSGGAYQAFVARFKGFEDGGSDKVPGIIIPTPLALPAGLALLGTLALRRRR